MWLDSLEQNEANLTSAGGISAHITGPMRAESARKKCVSSHTLVVSGVTSSNREGPPKMASAWLTSAHRLVRGTNASMLELGCF